MLSQDVRKRIPVRSGPVRSGPVRYRFHSDQLVPSPPHIRGLMRSTEICRDFQSQKWEARNTTTPWFAPEDFFFSIGAFYFLAKPQLLTCSTGGSAIFRSVLKNLPKISNGFDLKRQKARKQAFLGLFSVSNQNRLRNLFLAHTQSRMSHSTFSWLLILTHVDLLFLPLNCKSRMCHSTFTTLPSWTWCCVEK